MKTINVSRLSSRLVNLKSRFFGGNISSKEITKILKEECGALTKEVLSSFENHGILEFVNARTVRFSVDPIVSNIENLI